MRFRIPTPADFSFLETITAHGWRRLPPFVWHDAEQVLERAERMPNGALRRLRLRDGDNGVIVEVDGDAEEAVVAARVRRMLQLDVPLDGFHAHCRAHPNLCGIPTRRQGRMLRCPTLFEDVVKVIATTNTTWAQTIAMTTRLVTHFGAAFPTPAQIAALPFDEFSAIARMGYRSAFVHQIAVDITRGQRNLEGWQEPSLTAPELRKRLLSLPGIGPYGAACLMLYLGKPEHVNADSWARTLLSRELGKPVTDKDVHAFFAEHGAWRGLVYAFYPWTAEEA